MKSYNASPDRSGNPLEIKAYFFLGFSSDGRSSQNSIEKKVLMKEIATKRGNSF